MSGRVLLSALVAAVMATGVLVTGTSSAQAEPDKTVVRVVSKSTVKGRERLKVWSPIMGREITVDLQRPSGDGERPTLYMLDGAEAHDEESGWYAMTNLQSLAAAEKLNVVTPVGDPHSYYTDWRAVDPAIGKKYMYETFLTRELPKLIDAEYGGNGRNAIAGASMGGVAALTLTARHPALYQGVAGYSDCANISSLPNQMLTRWDVSRGGGNVENMWGPFSDPEWRAHDPYLLAANLRGKTIYMSSGNGVPGKYNNLIADPVDETFRGIIGEIGTWFCTGQISNRLSQLSIPFTTNLRTTGTHKWGYWRDELNTSWPMLMRSIGLR
ncbi:MULTISPECIES: alpha/beta hydrolase family protein [unclassified Gordonia (in: high G+C Gram-positive bacteria)]|uniref:alpha/beta hydrolase n=1 Tax=unclassified Gordonia (in: high G+C Gram-positive bacteria) TaxID=2657482 RepID=UPI001F0EC028|nr:alpha/beta hydrolase family protein [Gordonia sp. ABSL49_1]MCH5643427.1 esterase family protein [Gordonia sp. ABSL49_1]